MATKITACLQMLVLPVLLIPLRAEAAEVPSKTDLLGLTLLELLNEGLETNSDLTLNPLIEEAAGCVLFSRTSVRDSLIALIDRAGANDAGADSAAGGGRAAIESRVVELSGVPGITEFSSEVLQLTRQALAGDEDVFIDEILGEATDALGIEEERGPAWARLLTAVAARQLRSAPTKDLGSMPRGVHVLAVNFQGSEKKTEFQGLELSRWSTEQVAQGTSFITESLAKSMSLKRKFRRIVPCHELVDARTMHADYLLTLSLADQSWSRVVDPRTEEKDAEELLTQGSKKSSWEQRQPKKVLEMTLSIAQKLEALPAGAELWKVEKTVQRYLDELEGEEDDTFITREGWSIPRNTIAFGILELVVSQVRMDLARAR